MAPPSLLTLATTAATFLASSALAKQCVAFDTSNNLYAFGGTHDVSLGSSSHWSSPTPTTLTSSGRPPWTGSDTECHTSAFNDALYVTMADSKNLGDVYIYNFAKGTWSTQKTSGYPALAGSSSVIDHDTNVLYLFTSSGHMWYLDMSSVTSSASSKTLKWSDMGKAGFSTSGYKPVIGEASQHILFFGGAGDAKAGETELFVVHYAYYQPKLVSFPSDGHALPKKHGQVANIPYVSTNVAGDQVFFIPDDFSDSYVVSHWTAPGGTPGSASGAPEKLASHINTTQVFAAPPYHDKQAVYAATPSTVVQLTSAGKIAYALDVIDSFAVNKNAKWTEMSYTLPGL